MNDDSRRLDWLELVNCLHVNVELLYVVDGYELTVYGEDRESLFKGPTLRDAIDKAMAVVIPHHKKGDA